MRKPLSRNGANARQFEQRRPKSTVSAQQLQEKRTRAAAQIQHATVAAEVMGRGERHSGRRGEGLNTRRKDSLLLLVEALETRLLLAGAHGLLQTHPRRIADPVPKLQRRPQINTRAASEESASDIAVAVLLPL